MAGTASDGAGQALRGRRTADLVARRISADILRGEFPPGSRLREEQLAAAYRVSRTPVREALIELSTTGLVELIPNRGAMVLTLTLADVREVYEVRALLEGEAAGRAARVATHELLSDLARACDRLAALHAAPAAEQLAADTAFHYRIADASGNALLARLVRQVSAIPEAYRSLIAYTVADMREAERQHRDIAAELGRHHSQRAAALARAHVRWAAQMALDRLASRLDR